MTAQVLAVFAGVPVAVYLVLCLLPRGRAVWIGFALALAAMVALYLRSALAHDPWGEVLALFAGSAVALAGFAQTARHLLPGWAYAVLVPGLLLTAGGLAFKMVGA